MRGNVVTTPLIFTTANGSDTQILYIFRVIAPPVGTVKYFLPQAALGKD